MAVTLGVEDFKIDEDGNVRISIEKAKLLLELLTSVPDNANSKIKADSLPPQPVVKVEM